jgi:hypothetical protein
MHAQQDAEQDREAHAASIIVTGRQGYPVDVVDRARARLHHLGSTRLRPED